MPSLRGSVAFGVLVLLLRACPPAQAVDPDQPLTRCVVDQWTTRNGLPHNNVHAIVQTADGYLWVGTPEGLCRFDGARFTPIEAIWPRKAFLSMTLYPSRDGGLWLFTYGEGLWKVHEGQLLPCPGPFESGDNVEALWEEVDGTLWMGIQGRGVLIRRKDQWAKWTPPGGLPSPTVHTICITRDGSIWLGSDGGLSRVRQGRCITYTTRDGLPGNTVRSLLEDRDGSLWICTDGGLAWLRDEHFTAYTTRDGLPGNQVRAVCSGRGDTLWVATFGGLARLRRGRLDSFTTRQGLAADKAVAVWEDRDGSVWVATLTGGLNRLKDPLVATYGMAEGLGEEFIWSVCEGQGSMWFGTNSGLWQLKDGRFRGYTTRDGLPHNIVRGLCSDRDGNLWIGTAGGLARFRDGRFTTYTTRNGLSNDFVYAVLQDRSGTLWVGTRDGGLNALRDGKITVYTAPRDLPNATVRCLTEDPSGALWMATHGGVVRYHEGRFTTYTMREGLRSHYVVGVRADAAGNVWIFSAGGGLSRWREGRILSYGLGEGMPDQMIYQGLEDDRGGLWISSNRGIFRLRKQELDDIDAGLTPSVTPVLYGTADGMRSCECNGGNQSAGCRSPDGRLWFPTMQGVVTLDPRTLGVARPAPPVVLEQVLVNREPIDLHQRPLLSPGKRELEFRYTALSFLTPERLRFRYMLEGYDPDWIPAGTRREAFYMNLGPGDYRFRVQASQGDGTWGEAQPAFALRLEPSFYQCSWFYVACVAGVVGLGLAGHKVRVRLLEARERALQRRVQERTIELSREVQERKQAENNAHRAREEAESALAQVKQLRGLLPICSYCKKIRDDGDYWHQLEAYLGQHTDAQFSHGICPECWKQVVQPLIEGPPGTSDHDSPF